MLSLLYRHTPLRGRNLRLLHGKRPCRDGRHGALGLIAALALAGTASVATAQTATKLPKVAWASTANPSGLPWASGASVGGADLASYRGRALDVQTVFM